MYNYRIVIGDWSKDGHNQMDFYRFETSHPMNKIQKAYHSAVVKSQVALDGDSEAKFNLCCEYEDGTIPKEAVEILSNLGVDWEFRDSEFNEDGSLCASPEDMASLFLEMAKTQIPEFTYKLVEEEPCINGFWGKLNVSIGYGCYR